MALLLIITTSIELKAQKQDTVLIISPRLKKNYRKIRRLIKKVRYSGRHKIKLLHYREVTPERIKKIDPVAIVISGNNTPWHYYQKNSLNPLKDLIRKGEYPILGICGGHQLIGLSYGVPTGYIFSPQPVTTYRRCKRLRGGVTTYFLKNDPIWAGFPGVNRFYSYHCEDLKRVPPQFDLLAASSDSPIYMMRHKERPVYGVQFHPEKSRYGVQFFKNFFKIAKDYRLMNRSGNR